MIISTKAIVLKTIKYGETSLIVSLYTEALGVQSCIVQGVRKSSKSGVQKSSFFIVGTLLHVSLYHQKQKNLQRIKDFQFYKIMPNISTSIVKNAIVVMIMEVLNHTIQEPEQNEDIFAFVESILQHIESAYHIELKWIPHFFCLQFAQYLGFGIQYNYDAKTAAYLHLTDGQFCSAPLNAVQYCTAEQSYAIHVLNKANLNSLAQINIMAVPKKQILHQLIQYYTIHIPHMPSIKSIRIFETIFED
jgi:DNA repair protein RecO (recombination protein O)